MLSGSREEYLFAGSLLEPAASSLALCPNPVPTLDVVGDGSDHGGDSCFLGFDAVGECGGWLLLFGR